MISQVRSQGFKGYTGVKLPRNGNYFHLHWSLIHCATLITWRARAVRCKQYAKRDASKMSSRWCRPKEARSRVLLVKARPRKRPGLIVLFTLLGRPWSTAGKKKARDENPEPRSSASQCSVSGLFFPYLGAASTTGRVGVASHAECDRIFQEANRRRLENYTRSMDERPPAIRSSSEADFGTVGCVRGTAETTRPRSISQKSCIRTANIHAGCRATIAIKHSNWRLAKSAGCQF